jgi:glycosyltransferase involved in cell wall biosynthesis
LTHNQDGQLEQRIKWSVVVPAYNAESTIERLLTSLENQDIPRDQYEIIVADDGSKDATQEVVAGFPDVILLKQQNRGPSAARNLGARQAQGEAILFTDSDCEAPPDFISQMVKPLLDDPVIIGVKGAYLTRQSSLIAQFIQAEYEEKYRIMARRKYIDFVDTYAAAYRTEVFLQYNGFDEEYLGAEDAEFSYRLSQDGLRMVFNSHAWVYHLFTEKLKVFFRKKYHNGYWRLITIYRHRNKLLRDSHTPQVQKPQITLILIGLLCVPAGLFWHPIWYGALAAIVLHQILSLPFHFRILRKNPRLFFASFPLVFLRSFGLGLGMVVGAFDLVTGRCKISE